TLQQSSLFSQSCSQLMRPLVHESPFSSKLATQKRGVMIGLAPHVTAVRNAFPMQSSPLDLVGSNWQPSLQRSQESKIACGTGDSPEHEAPCTAFFTLPRARVIVRLVLRMGGGAPSSKSSEPTFPAVLDSVTARPSICPWKRAPSAVVRSM